MHTYLESVVIAISLSNMPCEARLNVLAVGLCTWRAGLLTVPSLLHNE